MAKKKKNDITIRSSAAEYLTFVASTGDSQDSVEMRYEDENIWLTQKMMATLYDVSVSAINQHIKKVFDDSELEPGATIKKYLIVQFTKRGTIPCGTLPLFLLFRIGLVIGYGSATLPSSASPAIPFALTIPSDKVYSASLMYKIRLISFPALAP